MELKISGLRCKGVWYKNHVQKVKNALSSYIQNIQNTYLLLFETCTLYTDVNITGTKPHKSIFVCVICHISFA